MSHLLARQRWVEIVEATPSTVSAGTRAALAFTHRPRPAAAGVDSFPDAGSFWITTTRLTRHGPISPMHPRLAKWKFKVSIVYPAALDGDDLDAAIVEDALQLTTAFLSPAEWESGTTRILSVEADTEDKAEASITDVDQARITEIDITMELEA